MAGNEHEAVEIEVRSIGKFRCVLKSDRIVYFDASACPDLFIDIEFAKTHIAIIKEMVAGKKLGGLADMAPKSTLEARKLYQKNVHYFHCFGIIANNVMERMLANFFIGLMKPKVPFQVFTDRAKAIKWMTEQLKEELKVS